MSKNIRVLSKAPKSLPCKLTDAEFITYASEMAEVTQDIHAEESRQASVKTDLKATMASLLAKQTQLSSIVFRKEDYKDIEVETILDFKAKLHKQIRTDTGEVFPFPTPSE